MFKFHKAMRSGAAIMAVLLVIMCALAGAFHVFASDTVTPLNAEANRTFSWTDSSVTATTECWSFVALAGYNTGMGAPTVFVENTDATDALMFQLFPVGTAAAGDLAVPANATASEVQPMTYAQSPLSFTGKYSGICYERVSADSSIVIRVRL